MSEAESSSSDDSIANRKNRRKLGDRLFADSGEKDIESEDNLKAMLK